SIVWRCISRLDPASAVTVCKNRTIKEEWLKDITVKAFNQILTGKDEFLRQLQENMVKAIRESDPSTAESIQSRLDDLQTELIRKANSKEDYDAIADEIFRLREEKEKADASARSKEDLQNRITELQVFLKDQQTAIAEFDERMVRKLIRQIIIYQDRAMIEFKSGLQITINE
ncbi:MAG: recombinase family protein, partial [Eubacterium sp.]|nr:recombinase family protein [Eubacterium sp.]